MGDGYAHFAEPLYERIKRMLEALHESGDQRSMVTAETWLPAVEKHRPASAFTGDPCAECGEPWPCKMLVDVILAIA